MSGPEFALAVVAALAWPVCLFTAVAVIVWPVRRTQKDHQQEHDREWLIIAVAYRDAGLVTPPHVRRELRRIRNQELNQRRSNLS